MSEGKADPKFSNAVIDTPPNGLHELQYSKLTNSTIDMIYNHVLYVNSKIKCIISSQERASRDHELSDTNSDESALLG